MAPSAVSTKRLIKELQDYRQEPSNALGQLGPVNDTDLYHWTATLKGLRDTAYEHGLWKLDIKIPDNYPHAPPVIKFVTPICHPNVHFKKGDICLDLLAASWSPSYTIAKTLESVQMLLNSAEPESPLNVDIAQLYRSGDQPGAEALIRYYTQIYRWNGN